MRRQKLKNVSVLAGPGLEYVPDATVTVTGDTFGSVASGASEGGNASTVTDCEGLLMIPGLINCHTHIGDSVGKDARLGGTVDEAVHPVFGLKPRILARTPPDMLVQFMRNSCISMLRGGTTTFVDFREGGIAGVRMLRRALAEVPVRGIVMGRPDRYHDADQLRRNEPPPAQAASDLDLLLKECDGLGISGANENSDAALELYSGFGKLRAVHASETEASVAHSVRTTGLSETARALALKPHFLVHMTHASRKDLAAVAASGSVRGIVVCPRANSALAEGLPDIVAMRQGAGSSSGSSGRYVLALGTDNVMINTPDMLREMDYTWKMTMGMHKRRMEPVEILRMATVNAGVILGERIGQIAPGMLADCVFLDKHSIDVEPMHSPHAAVVHRASASSIRAVMVGGRIVHGSIC